MRIVVTPGRAEKNTVQHVEENFAVRDFTINAFWAATFINVVVYLFTYYTIFCFISSPLAYLGYVAYKKNEYEEKWETKEVLKAVVAIPLAAWGAVVLNLVF